jgi:hypothetical protein
MAVHVTRLSSRPLGLLAAVALLVGAPPALSAEPAGAPPDRLALGLEVDLLPTVLSAIDGKFGVGGNVWVGYDRFRLRAVGTNVHFPPGFLTPDGFENRQLSVAAGIVDFFFLPGFEGPWVGAGVEYWWNTIGSPAGSGTASWNSWAVTAGAGYVWKVWGNFYLNPWAAAHLLLSRPEVTLYGATWTPAPVTAEVSLKIGWFLWL